MSTAPGSAASNHQMPNAGFGSRGYRNYVLGSLTLVFALNSMDRLLIGVVAQPLIEEFQMSDWEFGLLSGIGFALMYTLASIPIARLAERMNRVRIIAACTILWSVMTVACGFATGFISLLIFRIGVGIGEAGCTPPTTSLLGDYFIPIARARVLAIYGVGLAFGGLVANLAGGPIAEAMGWRFAFIILGAPGILVGLVIWFTVKEPPRGYSDPVSTAKPVYRSFGKTLAALAPKKTYWLLLTAVILSTSYTSSLASFQAPFYQRVHGLSVSEVAVQFIVPYSIAAMLSAIGAGYLTERLSPRYPNAVAWIPGLGILLPLPLYLTAFNTGDVQIARAALVAAGLLHYSYLGAQYTIAQGLADARSRATTIAIFLLISNLVSSLGPVAMGLLSDMVANDIIKASPFPVPLTLSECKNTFDVLSQTLGRDQAEACAEATRLGLQKALTYLSFLCIPSSVAMFAICKTLQRDLVAKMN